ncbi:MAG TPA: polymer-forming cytoskeletal protein [Alphaproteobacteria bacterium]|nr:polymer-forming cytoskeletal protein [Alphaproteobacteria bacterium]
MFHRVKSEVQKPVATEASETAVKERTAPAVQERPQESLIVASKAQISQQAAAQQQEVPTKKEVTMSEDTRSTDDRPAVAEVESSAKSVDIPGSAYQQQPARPASPYGNPAYPGFSAPANAAAAQAAAAPKVEKTEAERRLVIGQGISMSGQIESCDYLLVEGTIEAALKGARLLEISETGNFYGTVEIDEATIAGRFEGDLTVNGRLTVKSGGVIMGSISYKELEIQAGAVIDGKLSPLRAGGELTEKKPVRAKAAGSAPSKASKSDAPQPANNDGQLFASVANAE